MFTPQFRQAKSAPLSAPVRFVVRFYKPDGTRVMSGKLQANTYLRADVNGRIRAAVLSGEHDCVVTYKVLEVVSR